MHNPEQPPYARWSPTDQPVPPPPIQQNITINTPRTHKPQSCMIHGLLLITTAGIGNIAYAIWHNRRYNQ